MREPEHRTHKTRPGQHEMGRSTEWVQCPYCLTWTECYKWSLAGRGKRCPCGALHHWHKNETDAPRSKKS